jgi:flagellar basal-body rod protein FlgG
MEAYDVAMDVSANNIANVGTPGFRADAVEFQNLYAGAVAARIGTTSAAGGLAPTGDATNVAISGTGYFILAGPNGSSTYTRDGNFSVSANGFLVDTASGFTVTDVTGGPIAIPSGATGLTIGADGTVSATVNGGPMTLGRVALAAFQNPGGLVQVPGGFIVSANSGNVLTGAPATAGYGSLVSGFLETSNVDLAGEMIKMIASQAAYEANAKSVRTGDQMLQTAIGIGEDAKGEG